MSLGKDFQAIYSVVLKKTVGSYFKYIILVPLLVLYALTYEVSKTLLDATLGQLGAGGSFIARLSSWFIMSFVLSDFLSHLDSLIVNRKIKLSTIGHNRMTYFSSVLSATAIPNIIMYFIYMLLRIQVPFSVLILFYIIFAVPEVIYQKHKDRTDIFIYGYSFLKENWHLWGAINGVIAVIMFGLNITLYKNFVVPTTLKIITMDMNINIVYLIVKSLQWLSLSIPLVFVIILRGYLFKILSVSSRRKREYMRNIYGE